MKSIKFIGVFLLIGICGCTKESQQTSWEVPLNDSNPVIEQTVDGIAFKFCLLNEQGKPATKFKEGEPFSFYFAMTNHKSDDLNIMDHLVAYMYIGGFSKVVSQNDGTIWNPYEQGNCTDILQTIPFYGDKNHFELTIPWNEEPKDWGGLSCGLVCLHQPSLLKGIYYTEFSHKFTFDIKGDSLYKVGTFSFKINFEIE